MDSGCTYHMCHLKDYFETLELKEGGMVLLGNNKSCTEQGIFTIRLKVHDNHEIILQNVRYVPKLKRYLLSMSIYV